MNRSTETGYWKTTGRDRPVIYNERTVGMVKTLIFHEGHAPKGNRTDWVIHEYRIEDLHMEEETLKDSYVLCKVFKKSGLGPKNGAQYGAPFSEEDWEDDFENCGEPIPFSIPTHPINQNCSSVTSMIEPGCSSRQPSSEPGPSAIPPAKLSDPINQNCSSVTVGMIDAGCASHQPSAEPGPYATPPTKLADPINQNCSSVTGGMIDPGCSSHQPSAEPDPSAVPPAKHEDPINQNCTSMADMIDAGCSSRQPSNEPGPSLSRLHADGMSPTNQNCSVFMGTVDPGNTCSQSLAKPGPSLAVPHSSEVPPDDDISHLFASFLEDSELLPIENNEDTTGNFFIFPKTLIHCTCVQNVNYCNQGLNVDMMPCMDGNDIYTAFGGRDNFADLSGGRSYLSGSLVADHPPNSLFPQDDASFLELNDLLMPVDHCTRTNEAHPLVEENLYSLNAPFLVMKHFNYGGNFSGGNQFIPTQSQLQVLPQHYTQQVTGIGFNASQGYNTMQVTGMEFNASQGYDAMQTSIEVEELPTVPAVELKTIAKFIGLQSAVPPHSPDNPTTSAAFSHKTKSPSSISNSFPASPLSHKPSTNGVVTRTTRRILSPGRVSPIDETLAPNPPLHLHSAAEIPASPSPLRREGSNASAVTEECGAEGIFDARLSLKGSNGGVLVLELSAEALAANSLVFAGLIADYRRKCRGLCRIEVPDVDNLGVFRETIELMFEEDIPRALLRMGVCRAIDVLEVSAGIKFVRGILSCLKYIEAMPWTEEEEEKLRSLFGRVKFDDVTTRDILGRLYTEDYSSNSQTLTRNIVSSITACNDANVRNELKYLVKGLLCKSSVYEKCGELNKEDIFGVCRACLGSLISLFEEATTPNPCANLAEKPKEKPLIERISNQVDNINWLLDILLEHQMAEDLVDMWTDQAELLSMHERASPMLRYELSRVSAMLFIAMGTRKVHCRSEARSGLLQAWFRPMVSDFSWLRRCKKGLDVKVLEEAMGVVLLTLPLKEQYMLFMDWFRCFSKNGTDCPNLSKAFQIWWRRSFLKGSETHAAESR
nr:BTB/POZ domain-containing protein At2g13690 [Ipomoea batatas]